MTYLWLKAFHIIAIVTWFAALFYLPRLFVYHTLAEQEQDQRGVERFRIMERKLYRGIMMPAMLLTLLLGISLLNLNFKGYMAQGWMHAKLTLVSLLLIYHFWCGSLMRRLAIGINTHSHVWYRVFNELPVLILILVVLLAVVKPW